MYDFYLTPPFGRGNVSEKHGNSSGIDQVFSAGITEVIRSNVTTPFCGGKPAWVNGFGKVGVEGTLVALVSGGIDSPVAAWMMMKRGCRILPLYVALDTFLNKSNLGRAERVVEILSRYQPGITLTVIDDAYLAAAKKELVSRGQEKYTCILCKRRMYRIATAFAQKTGAKGIVTGESLGQVVSQTLDNLVVLNDAVTDLPVHRPLIAFDKEDTIRIAREIGTFPESISPVSGCEAVPDKPATKARPGTIRKIEAQIEADGLSLTGNIPGSDE